jgi:excisionase family DNA binding protein
MQNTKRARRGANQLATTNTSLALVGGLKLRQAARYISVSPMTVRRLVERGFLHPNRATRHLLFSIRDLDRFLAEGSAE